MIREVPEEAPRVCVRLMSGEGESDLRLRCGPCEGLVCAEICDVGGASALVCTVEMKKVMLLNNPWRYSPMVTRGALTWRPADCLCTPGPRSSRIGSHRARCGASLLRLLHHPPTLLWSRNMP